MPETRIGLFGFATLLLMIVLSFAAHPVQATDHCDAGYDACMGEAETLIQEMDCFAGFLACEGH